MNQSRETKIVVSIATIPSRIASLGPTLDSLMAGTRVPDQVLIVHPDFCVWEESQYPEVDFLSSPKFYDGRVVEFITTRDWGPSTKILGALEFVKDDCIMILADDDVAYHPSFVEGLVEAQERDKTSSFSYLTYRCFGLVLGQGVDGFSFWTPNLKGMQEFAERHVIGTTLMYHDDLWISFFLYLKRIDVKRLKVPDGRLMVYDQLLPNNVLSSVTSGSLFRANIVRDHARQLLRMPQVTSSQRRMLAAHHAIQTCKDIFDYAWAIPFRAARKVKRTLGFQ